MRKPERLKEEVEMLFERDETLFIDVHYTKQVLRLMSKRPWKSTGIIARQISKELMITKAAVSGKIRRLLEQGLIRSERGEPYYEPTTGRRILDGRTKLLTLTEKGRKIAEYIEFFGLPPRPGRKGRTPISVRDRAYAREFHSARIRELVETMLDHLPEIHTEDIYIPSSVIPRQRYSGQTLSFEIEVLFDDLGNHLLGYHEFETSLSKFRSICREFQRKKKEALRGIELDASKYFGLSYSPDLEELESLSSRMMHWIFEGGVYLANKNTKKYFDHYYASFDSRVTEEKVRGHGVLQYWVSGRSFIQTGTRNHESEVFQKENDEKLASYMKNMAKAPFYQDIEAAQGLIEKARRLRARIESILRKNLEVPIFGGACEYLNAML